MMMQSLSRKYALAFLDTLSQDEYLELLGQKQQIQDYFKNDAFQELIKNPFIDCHKKFVFIGDVLMLSEGRIRNALSILTQANRLELLPEVLREMESILMNRNQKYCATIFLNSRPNDKELRNFQEKISEKIGYDIEIKEKKWDQEGIKCYVEGLDLEISFSSKSFIQNLEIFILDTFKKGV